MLATAQRLDGRRRRRADCTHWQPRRRQLAGSACQPSAGLSHRSPRAGSRGVGGGVTPEWRSAGSRHARRRAGPAPSPSPCGCPPRVNRPQKLGDVLPPETRGCAAACRVRLLRGNACATKVCHARPGPVHHRHVSRPRKVAHRQSRLARDAVRLQRRSPQLTATSMGPSRGPQMRYACSVARPSRTPSPPT